MLRSRRLFTAQSLGDYEEPTVNLTPLIDVVFVILIAFIIVAPLLNYEQIALATGGAELNHRGVTEQSPVVISVKADNGIILNEQRVKLQELPERLQKLRERFPKATPQLFHDQYATFGTYCTVKNALERAGYTQLDIVVIPPGQKGN